jgi:sugar fermentation stimulation protein A
MKENKTMRFYTPLIEGVLIRRYKRFLADVRLMDGTVVTAHCANTGSMLQMAVPGSRVMLSVAANPERKTQYDWQLTEVEGRWAGINTAVPNMLIREGFEQGIIPEFREYSSFRAEVPYGEHSRVDALLSGHSGNLYVEAKNVTLVENGRALFPDAVTERGLKHLDELIRTISQGHRAAMFFLTQRMDAETIGAAVKIDPVYAVRLREASDAGVGIIAWRAHVSPEKIVLDRPLPFVW